MAKTILDATKEWVREFNAIPTDLIERAYKNEPDDLREIVRITVGDVVYSHDLGAPAEVVSVDRGRGKATVLIDGEAEEVDIDGLFREYESWLPMWGWMWTFDNSLDEWWVRENLDTVADCGFRIFESDELGIILGIDGAGYDFYEAHWVPLYKARGLKWHDEDVTE